MFDARTRRLYPFIERIFADGAYQGPQLAKQLARVGPWLIEIVKRPDIPRFEPLPKRWIVERTLACMSRNCRLAMIRFMLRRLARSSL